jgi:hypothetical protein
MVDNSLFSSIQSVIVSVDDNFSTFDDKSNELVVTTELVDQVLPPVFECYLSNGNYQNKTF